MEFRKMRSNEFLTFAVIQRNRILLDACFLVHAILIAIYMTLRVRPMIILNILSVLFYGYLIFIKRTYTNRHIVITYFEILIFSVVSTFVLGKSAGYQLFILGMVSIVFQFARFADWKKYIYMICGFLGYAVTNFVTDSGGIFAVERGIVGPHETLFFWLNFFVTLIFVIMSSYLYEQNISTNVEKLNKQSFMDPLTGLWNRRGFDNFLFDKEDTKYCVAILDIDFFKNVNDTYGHAAGDEVLRQMARTLKKSLRENDACARWGGEEFVVYLDITDPEQAYHILERIAGHIRQIEFEDYPDLHITITIGLARKDRMTFSEAIKLADERLYKGKQNGRNQVVWK